MEKETPASAPALYSTEIDKLADALAKAQGEFPVIPKDSEVIVYTKDSPKRELYRYKYADLTTIISCTRPALSKNGISFTQGFVRGGVATFLMHSSGQTLECGFIPCDIPKSADYKQVAGAVTYVKRISLTAALGVSADEDVDAAPIEGQQGNSTTKGPAGKAASAAPASKQSKPTEKKPPAQSKNYAPASKQMVDRINELCIDRGIAENILHYVITEGYGEKVSTFKHWQAIEVGNLLSSEDTTEGTLMAHAQRLISRREAERIKREADQQGVQQ